MPSPTELIADLSRAFPRQPVTRDTLVVYLRELSDMPVEVLEPTIRELIRTSEFFPTVRAIREAAAERSLGLPSEADALSQIEARMLWARTGSHGEQPPVHPLVKEALDHIGGWHAFRAADEPSVVRGQFLRLYRELRLRGIREAQIGDLALPAGAARPELSR